MHPALSCFPGPQKEGLHPRGPRGPLPGLLSWTCWKGGTRGESQCLFLPDSCHVIPFSSDQSPHSVCEGGGGGRGALEPLQS